MATAAAAETTAKALSEAKVVADAQAKTKQYLGRIEAAVDASANQCIEESHLDQELVGHGKRTVGKVRAVRGQHDNRGKEIQQNACVVCGGNPNCNVHENKHVLVWRLSGVLKSRQGRVC